MQATVKILPHKVSFPYQCARAPYHFYKKWYGARVRFDKETGKRKVAAGVRVLLTRVAFTAPPCAYTRGNHMSGNSYGPIRIFGTNSGKALAEKICPLLSLTLGQAHIGRFNDGEVEVKINENVRGFDVFIVADIHGQADNLMEAILLADAARLSSAGRVTYVISKFGYDRSDRKDAPRKPIGVKIAIKMLEIAHPDRVIVLDIHAEQSMALFDETVHDHLFGSPIATEYLAGLLRGEQFVVASPDRGGVPRAEKYATLLKKLGVAEHDDIVVFSKRRPAAGEVQNGSVKILGDVANKAVVFVDDMIDTGGTMIEDAKAARAAGAKAIYVFATHGIFSKNAMERIKESLITRVFVTDSIEQDPKKLRAAGGKVAVLSAAALLADAIRRTHEGESLSKLIP